MKRNILIIGLMGLMLFFMSVFTLYLGCGSVQTTPQGSTYYKDVYNGYTIYCPEGWDVETSAGVILVKKDVSGETAASVYPVRLINKNLTAKEFLGYYFSAVSNFSSGTNSIFLQLTSSSETDSNNSSADFSGTIDGKNVAGKISVTKQALDSNVIEVVYKSYWALSSNFASETENLERIINNYSKLSPGDIELFTSKTWESGATPAGSASFIASYPAGWDVAISGRGLDLSAADSSEGVSLGVVYPVIYTPSQFVDKTVEQITANGYSNFVTLWEKSDYPQIIDTLGYTWNFYCREVTFTNPWGQSCKGVFYCGVSSLGSGAIAGAGMLTLKLAWLNKWENVKDKLTAIEGRIKIVNLDNTGANIKYPQPQPADDSAIMSSWEYKNKVNDKANERWSEYILGYERAQDSRGDFWDVPIGAYDPAIGGYNDPTNPGKPMTVLK